MSLETRREVAMECLKSFVWPFAFPPGKPLTDGTFRAACRDAFLLADVFRDVGELGGEELLKLGQPPLGKGKK